MPTVLRCDVCRTAMALFGSVRAGGDEANLWFARVVNRQSWRVEGRAATVAEVRVLLARKAFLHAQRRRPGRLRRVAPARVGHPRAPADERDTEGTGEAPTRRLTGQCGPALRRCGAAALRRPVA
jgi:hypothetical protein